MMRHKIGTQSDRKSQKWESSPWNLHTIHKYGSTLHRNIIYLTPVLKEPPIKNGGGGGEDGLKKLYIKKHEYPSPWMAMGLFMQFH